MAEWERTHTCGELTKNAIGTNVTLSGWVHRRRDHGGLIFIDLRDKFGLTQLVFDPKVNQEAHTLAEALRSEFVLTATGKVIARAEGMTNPKLHTGEIEIEVEKLTILSPAKTPPFSICEEIENVSEELRLRYRYLDMRRGDLIHTLQLRHKAQMSMRHFLDSKGFIEVTTPILGKSTPEGARDYLVPSRLYPGHFYALPQSPQLFKQLLMIGGLDRYFQFASCFRDEDLRADRQPEFMQLDIEMSFSSMESFLPFIESMIQKLFKDCLGKEIKPPFQRLSYAEAMEKYGCDKPDLRFDMPLVRIDTIAKASSFSILQEALQLGGIVKALCVKGGEKLSRRIIDGYIQFVTQFGLGGLAWMKKTAEGYTSSIVKFFSEEQLGDIDDALQVEEGDLVLIAAGKEAHVNQALDHLRRKIAKEQNLIDPNQFAFAWIVDFPMFEYNEEERLVALHHPFTMPHPDDIPLLEKEPTKVRSVAYDLVLNGFELGGGSQRIHDPELQKKIFSALTLSEKEIEEKFGFFVRALSYGTPPHMGLAFGLDRIVMLLAQKEQIRSTIAFPKTQKGHDLMLAAPSSVSQKQLEELNLEIT